MIEEIELKYGVGALLYTPANNEKISRYIQSEKFGKKYSLALCLEDTISDYKVNDAENQLIKSMEEIYKAKIESDFFCPNIFIRVRSAQQITDLYEKLNESRECLSGFIIPKYSVDNASEYNNAIMSINSKSDKKVFMMPILESKDIVNLALRAQSLCKIKEAIDSVKEYVLNVRVGGNDFSNQFAVRRHINEAIYDNMAIAQILSDIITVFSSDYVVSGPVWEYFDGEGDEWKIGLENELKLDQLNGFIGKTVIHPNQIPVVNEALKVSREDYKDALEIINWDENDTQVGKNNDGQRMNEVKTHYNWACKIVTLAKLYGVL